MPALSCGTDERSERALAELMTDGSTASEAIRQALVDTVRLRRREQMRIESLALMNDEADRAESRKVLDRADVGRCARTTRRIRRTGDL
jgi:predicted phage gp36 major capsid-like protein